METFGMGVWKHIEGGGTSFPNLFDLKWGWVKS